MQMQKKNTANMFCFVGAIVREKLGAFVGDSLVKFGDVEGAEVEGIEEC